MSWPTSRWVCYCWFWLIRELGLSPERPNIDNWVTIIDLDTHVTLNHSLERDQ